MTILDAIKKKIHAAETDEKKIASVKKKAEVKDKEKSSVPSGREEGVFFSLLKSPHITEKSSAMQAVGKYVFKVSDAANKNEIKKAMENIFKVKVTGVNIVNARKKRVRLGRHEGWSRGFKKAIVTLKKGDKIEIGV